LLLFHLFKGGRGHELFKNLLRGGGNRVDFFVLGKTIVERWKRNMGWVWVCFLRLYRWWRRGVWVIFLHFFYFHVCNFLGSFTHKGEEKVGYGAFLLKNIVLLLMLLIVCKFSVFFSFSKAERGGTGLRSLICIY